MGSFASLRMTPRKIALIGCTVNPRAGGMGRALFDHAVALSEAGQEVAVYTLDSIAALGAPLQNDRFTVRELPRLFSIGKAAWGARFDPPLDAYDVVHLHLPFFGVAEAVRRWFMSFRATRPRRGVEKSDNVVVILSERSELKDLIEPIRSLDSGFALARDDKKEAASQPQDDKKRLFVTYHMDAIGTGLKRVYFNWWYRHRFKKVLDACDAIAVTSRAYARDSWLARVGVDVEKCEEILLRVDTGKFMDSIAPPAAGLQNDNYFLFVGALDRAHYFKGLSLLLRAFGSLDPRFRGDDRERSGDDRGETASGMTEEPRLVVVGAGELLEQYKKEAVALGIADRVQFTGGVTDEELARWYAGARALVLPSTDRSEAFGIVLIEAMACGTPVIASDLPGVREVVGRVSGGVLVAPPTKDRIELDSSARGLRMTNVGKAPRNDNLVTALQHMWQQPWSDDDRAALAARTASVYGRATLADQLLRWYNYQ